MTPPNNVAVETSVPAVGLAERSIAEFGGPAGAATGSPTALLGAAERDLAGVDAAENT